MDNTAQNMDANKNLNQTPAFQSILNRIKGILIAPEQEWDKIKAENSSIIDIYKNYLIYLAAIGPIVNWIKGSMIGVSFLGITYRTGVVSGLVQAVLQYGMALLMAYVAALILEKLAPKFGGSANITDTFRLVAYAATPGYLAAVFGFIPALAVLVALLAFGYSIYLFFKGLPKFIQIPQGNLFVYILVSVIAIIIAGLIIGLVVAAISPAGVDMGTLSTKGGEFNLDSLKDLQKMIPQP